jgi:hypothetical protein
MFFRALLALCTEGFSEAIREEKDGIAALVVLAMTRRSELYGDVG